VGNQQPPRTIHLLPSFQWDPVEQQWVMLPMPAIPMTDAARKVIDHLVEEEMPPQPKYHVGDTISFTWEGQVWSGPIERILVWGIWSYFTVNGGIEEEQGARARAIQRSYHQPQSLEYVVWSHDHTRYVQAHTVIEQVDDEKSDEEEEEPLSFTAFFEEELEGVSP